MWFSHEERNPKPDDDADIAAFYDDLDKTSSGDGDDCPTTLAASTSDAATQIRDFIEQEEQEQSPGSQTFPLVPHNDFTSALSPITRLAIVTSGSVPTPLDTDSVNYLDTLGSGNRAAACAEEFLKRGYHVVFLYREGSLRPFSRVLAKRMKKAHTLTDQVQLNPETGRLELVLDADEGARIARMLTTYESVKPRLLEVSFSDLFEYLYLLREACRAAAPLGHGALLFLAAGLTKMFIPRHDLTRPSAAFLDQGKEALKLSPVPHVIRAARQSWCPQAFLVAFKLENDTLSLVEGAHRLLERHGLHLVVGNTVRERNRRVLIVTERDEIKLVSPQEKELEPSMVKTVVRNHKQFALEREALKSSRSLLGLSAKFTMLRENKSVVDEDAYGRKQVPFKVGLRIKGDRKKADSPIYELKAVYTNRGGSARANLWQRVIAEEEEEEEDEEGGEGGEGGRGGGREGGDEAIHTTSTAAARSPETSTTTKGKGELLLTFSPAGNPETILSLWGDTYKGWLEEEVKRILAAAKHIPITTYLKILAAPLTADFTDLADLLAQLRLSIASAWEKREKTQFIQSYNNLMSLAFDRALTPLEGLMDAQELLDRRRLMELLLEEEEGGRAGSVSSFSTSPSPSVLFGRTPSGAIDIAGGKGGGGGGGGEVKAVKLHKPVFRGLSLGSMLQQNKQRFSRRRSTLTATGGGGGKGGSRLSQSRFGVPVAEVEKEEEALVAKAGTVRVHNTVKRFAEEMFAEGVLDDVLAHLESSPDCRLVVTGYSLGGMLSQIFCLRLGEALLQRGLSTRQVLMMGFGSPRVGDEGFKARLRLLYPKQSALMNVVYPLDTLHAFPPAAEGYADAVVKVFLRQPGQFVGRRAPSRALTPFATPLTWLRVFDSKVDELASKHRDEERERAASESAHGGASISTSSTKQEECRICGSDAHTTLRHRCRTCTERGSHRSADCPNKDLGCKLCGLPDHPTGQHLCSVCKLHGHRGRYCHELASVGWAELAAFALFHDASYYSFATAAEDPVAVQRMAAVPLTPSRASRPHEGVSKVLGVTFKEEDMEQLEVVNQL